MVSILHGRLYIETTEKPQIWQFAEAAHLTCYAKQAAGSCIINQSADFACESVHTVLVFWLFFCPVLIVLLRRQILKRQLLRQMFV